MESKLCENYTDEFIKVNDYYELQEILKYNGYETPVTILDAYHTLDIIEEVQVNENSKKVLFTVDNYEIDYNKVKFLIRKFCKNKIENNTNFCKECNSSSENEKNQLSVSKKIQLILINSKGKKLSSTEIYKLGIPWEATGKTPKNTIVARCSTLHKQGFIKRDGKLYYS